MLIPLQITIRDTAPSDELERHIRDKAKKLDEFFDHITSCHVTVEMPHRHRHQGRQYNVRVSVSVPGHEIVVNHDHHEDVYVALRDAFDAAKRQIEDYVRQLRGHAEPEEQQRSNKSVGLTQ
jgi:ribosomal subunit interface protein